MSETTASAAEGDERGAFALLETREDEEEGPSYVDVAGREVRVFRAQVYDHVTQVLRWTTEHRWYEGGELQTKRRHVDVRFTFPQELVALLDHHGFEVVRQYGDWNLEPLSALSRSIIVVCRKRPRASRSILS